MPFRPMIFHAALASLLVCGLAPRVACAAEISGLVGNLKFVQSVEISGEEAGVIRELPVREGSRLEEGDLVARLDDRTAQAARAVAKAKHDSAVERSNEDVEIRYAEAAGRYAKVDWEIDVAVNKTNPGTIPDINIKQKKLAWDKAVLQHDKALHDQLLAKMDTEVTQAELDAAELVLKRRTITAPFAGEVQTLFARESEWVNPGDPILRLVRLDKLYVDIFVKAAEYDAHELEGCGVTATATLARDRTIAVNGRVIFVDQDLKGGPTVFEYAVRAEIENTTEDGNWVLRSGMPVEVVIHLDQKSPR